MKIDNQLIALDLETSDGTFDEGVKILEVGAVHIASGEEFYLPIRHKKLLVSPRASRVHNIDLRTVDSQERTPLPDADHEAREWIRHITEEQRQGKAIAVGWGVSVFDLRMMREVGGMPKAASMFRRSGPMELGAICHAIDFTKGMSPGWTRGKVKVRGPEMHNALADARYAAEALWNIRELIEDGL